VAGVVQPKAQYYLVFKLTNTAVRDQPVSIDNQDQQLIL
ncbi:uncharacterized protein METZ01_LOCUS449237, partial [marine metagenome]